jgi:hypothetical protein
VALQRKGVKRRAIELVRKSGQIAKEFASLEGARGVQTFYMTVNADEPKNRRDNESAQHLFATGLS